MLTILDSAIRVDRSYPYPYFNKVASFVELGLYNEAIKNVEKTIALLPGFQPAYLRAALIYQFYIKDFSKARAYYRKAYGVANQAGKNNKHVKLDLDLNIAHALYFYKGRSESLTYIDSIKKYYSNDPKSISTIESFKRLISQPLTEMNVKGSFAAYFK
jgi:tetratricopeptide (TPR) repeat protein